MKEGVNMTTISLIANDQLLLIGLKPTVASDNVNTVKLHVDFSEEWDGFAKSAVFFHSTDTETIYEMILTDGDCFIPHEVMDEAGLMFIGVRGIKYNGLTKASTLVKYKVDEGSPAGSGTTVEPTPDVYQQLLKKIDEFQRQKITVELPIFVDSEDDMSDQNELYVLNDTGVEHPHAGEVYSYRTKQTFQQAQDVFQNSGYELNKRLGSSGISAATGHVVSGMIPIDMTQETPYILRVKGLTSAQANGGNNRIGYFDSSGTMVEDAYWWYPERSDQHAVVVEPDGKDYLIKLDTPASGSDVSFSGSSAKENITHIRVCNTVAATTITSDDVSAIQMMKEVENVNGTETNFFPTGIHYPASVNEQRLAYVEEQAEQNTTDIILLRKSVEDSTPLNEQYPSVWDEAVEECIAKIKALQVGRNCVTFTFFSDNHQRLGYSGALISKVMEACHIPYCLYGGDSIDSGYIASESVMIAQDKAFDDIMKAIPNGRLCRAVGNHDGYWAVDANNKNYYTREQIYELFLREESISQLKHFGDDGTYYFVDDVASKTRFIILNSNGGFGETQRNWVQNKALQFNESGWAVVFVSHAPVTNNLHANISDAQTMQTLLTNYINGSSTNKADIVGWFSGHIHMDRIYKTDHTGNTKADDQTTSTLPWKTVTITSDHTSIAYDDATKHTVAEDDQSHAIDFVTINKNTKTVNITRLGIGNDRSYSY